MVYLGEQKRFVSSVHLVFHSQKINHGRLFQDPLEPGGERTIFFTLTSLSRADR